MAKIKIMAFGKIVDLLEVTQLELEFEGNSQELIHQLKTNYPTLNTIQFSIAVNHSIKEESIRLNEGDEVALLPPFSGG
jgi:sulfur-carrier protein